MKRVFLTAFIACSVTAAYAQPPVNTTDEDEVVLQATVNIADMIDLEPELNQIQANIDEWSQWISGATQFDPTNPAQTGTNFRVWATRGFTISVKSTPLTNASAVNANSNIDPNRLGMTMVQNWVSGASGGGPFVSPAGTTWTDIMPIAGDAGQPAQGTGLTLNDQVIVSTTSGAHNARFVGKFWFQPRFDDNAGGTYLADITVTAEIKP